MARQGPRAAGGDAGRLTSALAGRAAAVREREQLRAAGAVAVLLLAAALRLWELERLPGGLHFNLAANLFDAVEVGESARPVYFPRKNGREPLLIYMQTLAGMLLGVTAFSVRLVTVGLGVASVAAVGFAARQVVLLAGRERRRAEVAALVAGSVLAGMYWSVHFSRFGLRTAAVPLLLALAFGLAARGLRGRSWVEQLAAGLCLGLALDSWTGARLARMAMVLPFLTGLAWERRLRWLAWLALLALGAAVAFAPLGLHYIRQPADFAQHSYDTSVLSAGSPGWAAVRGVATTAASFVARGSPGAAENLPGRPLLDPLGAMLLVVGLVVAVNGLRGPLGARLAAVLLLNWLAVMSLPSALAVPSPGYVRLSGAVPAAALLAAIGGVALAEWMSRRLGAWVIRARAGRSAVWRLAARWGRPTRAERGDGADPGQVTVLVATIVAISAAWTVVDYFGTWATWDAYRAAMQDKADAAVWLLARPPGERVFLAPLWATDFGVQFLTRAPAAELHRWADYPDRRRGGYVRVPGRGCRRTRGTVRPTARPARGHAGPRPDRPARATAGRPTAGRRRAAASRRCSGWRTVSASRASTRDARASAS